MGWPQHELPEAEIFQGFLQSFGAGQERVPSVNIFIQCFTSALYSPRAGARDSTTANQAGNTEKQKVRRQVPGIQTRRAEFLGGTGDRNAAQSIKTGWKLTSKKALQSNPKKQAPGLKRIRMFKGESRR